MRLAREYLSYRSMLLLLALILLAPVQFSLVSNLILASRTIPSASAYLFFPDAEAMSAYIYLVPVDTALMLLVILRNISGGIRTDIERGYFAIHLSVSEGRWTILAAELVSTTVIPYTVLFLSLFLTASAVGFQSNPAELVAGYLFNFLPLLLFFSMMMLIAIRGRESSRLLFPGALYMLIFLSLSYVITRALHFMQAVLLVFGMLVPGYLAGIYYYTTNMPSPIFYLGRSPFHNFQYNPYPLVNFGTILLDTIINISINIALLLLIRYWSRAFEVHASSVLRPHSLRP